MSKIKLLLNQRHGPASLSKIHAHLITHGHLTIPSISHKLLDSYALSHSPHICQLLFHQINIPTTLHYNSLIKAFSYALKPRPAIHYYNRMLSSRSPLPNTVTFLFVLKACEKIKDQSKCKEIHASIIRSGFDLDVVVTTNLIRCYAAVGGLEDVRKVFDEMPQKDLIAWNSMVSCYSQLGLYCDALKLFDEMRAVGIGFDGFSLVNLVSACGHLGAMNVGVELHKLGIKNRLLDNVFVGNALIDMYAKCGRLDEAVRVFNGIRNKDVYSWNSIIGGYGAHGFGHAAISYFNKMLVSGLTPDSVTFIGVLSGCCHQGLVHEGVEYFNSMSSKFGVKPNVKHYGCIVDMLGRAGKLNSALEIIETSEFVDTSILWRTILASCRVHGDVENGEKAMRKLRELKMVNAGDCVLLSGIYTDLQDLRGSVRMRKIIEYGRLKTTESWSRIDNEI